MRIELNHGAGGLALLLFASVLFAQTANVDVQSLIDNRVKTAKKAVGMVVGTVDAKGAHIYSSGTTSIGGTESPNGDTLFEIGSISKVFTSLILADMIERGEVKGDDPVAKYLPEHSQVPSRNGKQITLLNLSMQNSGLPRLPENFKPADPANPYADYDAAKLLAFLASYKLSRDPGREIRILQFSRGFAWICFGATFSHELRAIGAGAYF